MYYRSQLDHQFQLTNYAYDNKEDAVIRDEKFFVLHKEDQQNQRRIDESFSNIRHGSLYYKNTLLFVIV